ncbi:MAG TPA: hypothetical protein VGP33_15900 [Chloroflexota bacterium]|nr:hypothetical protein [Chloroflexota bacterium]
MSLTEMVIRGLVADYNVACSVCGTRFRRSGLRVVRRQDDVWQISARCPSCEKITLLMVKLDASGIVSDLELNRAERERFTGMPAISADDVLELAGYLATFDGDFKALFAQFDAPPAESEATEA